MKTTVKLRNKDGQYCTLAQFCAEEPVVEINRTRGISYATEELPAMKENLLRLEQLLEVIEEFNLPERSSAGASNTIRVGVSNYGTAHYCLPTKETTHAEMITIVKAWIVEAEALAAKWQATEYTV